MTQKPREFGEVHAPIEDTDTPFGLKLIVLVLILTVLVLGTIIVSILSVELPLLVPA